jgi:hypothetical protein
MRRMILPERVFGRPGAHWIASGEAIAPISWRRSFALAMTGMVRRLNSSPDCPTDAMIPLPGLYSLC